MPNLGTLEVCLPVRRDTAAECVCGAALANAGDVVLLAFDRHQRWAFDLRQIDQPATVPHDSARQLVIDEHLVDGLNEELAGQVHDRRFYQLRPHR